jgi:preprotein translocase subunit SecG
MLQTIVLFCHLGVALLIIVLVLLQRGKGADAGTGFGAGASGTVFGARGTASFFSRATAVLATIFFVTSLALAWFAGQQSEPESLLDSVEVPAGAGLEPPPAPSADDSALPGVLETSPAPTAADDVSEEAGAAPASEDTPEPDSAAGATND